MKILLFILALLLPSIAEAAYPSPFADYGYCQEWTMTAGATGVATTTTNGFLLWATTTNSVFATVANGGHISTYNTASSTPTDFVFGNGTDCDTGGTLIEPIWDSYDATTGAIAVGLEAPDVSSTTAKTVLVYYGKASDTDHEGTFDQSGLIGIWPLGFSKTIWDTASTSYDITPDAMPALLDGFWSATSTVDGVIGKAIQTDTASYTDLGNNLGIYGAPGFSISMWWKPLTDQIPFQQMIASQKRSGFAGWQLDRDNAEQYNFTMQTSDTAATTASGETVFQNTNWRHLTGVYNGSTVMIYVDAMPDDSTPSAMTGTVNINLGDARHVCIGRPSVGTGNCYDTADGATTIAAGAFDQVRIYTYGLHPMDILSIYNNERDSEAFWTFGAEESAPSGGTTVGTHSPRFFFGQGMRFIGKWTFSL